VEVTGGTDDSGQPEHSPDGWTTNRRTDSIPFRGQPDAALAAAASHLAEQGWVVSDSQAGITARRELQRAAQLQPVGDEGRRLLGIWSLKDRYPPGIARGGCIMAKYSYRCDVTVGQGTLEVECEEVISAFRGSLPDPKVFWIRSELDALDPAVGIQAAITQ
jgi:hypothetical protein